MPAVSRPSIKCVLCDREFIGRGARGSCKRHLEQQHISPHAYQCKTCLSIFHTKTEIKNHCKSCGNIDRGWNDTTVERNLFASEFTGVCYTAKHGLLEHLSKLCDIPEQDRPAPCYVRKLHCLLENPMYHEHVKSLSQRTLGSPSNWKDLRWDQQAAAEAAEYLESFNYTDTGGCPNALPTKIQSFLQQLISSRIGHTNSGFGLLTLDAPFHLDDQYEQTAHSRTPLQTSVASEVEFAIANNEQRGQRCYGNTSTRMHSLHTPVTQWMGLGQTFVPQSADPSQLEWLPQLPLDSGAMTMEFCESRTADAGGTLVTRDWQQKKQHHATPAAHRDAVIVGPHLETEVYFRPPHSAVNRSEENWELFDDEYLYE